MGYQTLMDWIPLIVFALSFSVNSAFQELGMLYSDSESGFNLKFHDRAVPSKLYAKHVHDFTGALDQEAFQGALGFPGNRSEQDCPGCEFDSGTATKGLFKCSRDLRVITREIKNGSSWAIEFLDSTGKIPDGFLRGNRALGNYDECLSIESKKFNISSQYCLVIAIHLKLKIPVSLNGLCAPISCNPKILEKLLNSQLNVPSIFLSVDEKTCQHAEPAKWTSECTIFVTVVAIYILTLLILTVLCEINIFRKPETDVKNNSKDPISNVCIGKRQVVKEKVTTFCKNVSLVNNFKKIFYSKSSENDISCLHGLRFFSMCWVVIGHSLALSFQFLNANWIDAYQDLNRLSMQVLMNATVSVDTFFVLSGTLAAFGLMHAYDTVTSHKMAVLKAGYILLARYIRLTPLLLVLAGYLATINILTGDGPFWFTANSVQQENCRMNMWTNLLYVQNYVETSTMCLGHSWYLACDMHFFLLTLIMIPIMRRYPLIGIGVILSGVMASDAYVTIITYLKNYPPTIVLNAEARKNVIEYFQYVYIASHGRFGPYGIGIILGYCLYKYRKTVININKVYIAAGWIIFSATALLVVFGMFHYNKELQGTLNTISIAFYSGLHRTAWALSISWIIFACHRGYGGWIQKILSLEIFVPLGRLTYSTYLISFVIQSNVVSSTKGFIYYDGFLNPYLIYLGMLSYILFIASFLTLVFESPWVQITKLIVSPKRF